MPETPLPGPARRHRTRQRERILAWLRATDAHPTAAQIHDALAGEFPRLSLGTVYRNLEVLTAEGLVREVHGAGPALRYDGNTDPHHHFECSACGRLLDVQLPRQRALEKRLQREYGLVARQTRIDFTGLCPDCGPQAPTELTTTPTRGDKARG